MKIFKKRLFFLLYCCIMIGTNIFLRFFVQAEAYITIGLRAFVLRYDVYSEYALKGIGL